MTTISKIVERIVISSPFLEEAIAEKLVNVSSLARKIKPQIESELKTPVKEGAIVMAINRLNTTNYDEINTEIRDFVNNLGDIIVRSKINSYTFENSDTLTACKTKLLGEVDKEKKFFCTFSQGVYETTVVISEVLDSKIQKIFTSENMLAQHLRLSSITVKLPRKNSEVSGLYYFIFKKLAWDGINIIEIISTTNEFTVVVKDVEVDRAFSILMNLKKF